MLSYHVWSLDVTGVGRLKSLEASMHYRFDIIRGFPLLLLDPLGLFGYLFSEYLAASNQDIDA